MITQETRVRIIEKATSAIRGMERSKLESFLTEEAPNKTILESGSIKEKCLMVETSNKSNPYLELRRNLELDTSGEPCYSFSLISHNIGNGDREKYLGTFGHQEMVEGLFMKSQKEVSRLSKPLETSRDSKPPKKVRKNKTNTSEELTEVV